jgi:hypothetical protein
MLVIDFSIVDDINVAIALVVEALAYHHHLTVKLVAYVIDPSISNSFTEWLCPIQTYTIRGRVILIVRSHPVVICYWISALLV